MGRWLVLVFMLAACTVYNEISSGVALPLPLRPPQQPQLTRPAGDRIATAALLPRIEVGDHVMVLDTGAYTLSMVSRYNSRCSPAVYGFSNQGAVAAGGGGGGGGGGQRTAGSRRPMQLERLRGRERLEQVLAFWNLGEEGAVDLGRLKQHIEL